MTKQQYRPRKTELLLLLSRRATSSTPDEIDTIVEYTYGGTLNLDRDRALDFDAWDQTH